MPIIILRLLWCLKMEKRPFSKMHQIKKSGIKYHYVFTHPPKNNINKGFLP